MSSEPWVAAGSFAKKPLIVAGSFIAPLAGLVAPIVLPGEAIHLQSGKRKPPKEGLRVVAGLGFEPRLGFEPKLTYPEPVHLLQGCSPWFRKRPTLTRFLYLVCLIVRRCLPP